MQQSRQLDPRRTNSSGSETGSTTSESDTSRSHSSDSDSDDSGVYVQQNDNDTNNNNESKQEHAGNGQGRQQGQRGRAKRRNKRTAIYEHFPGQPRPPPTRKGFDPAEHIGDALEPPQDGYIRIGSGNIGGFHTKATNNPVVNALRCWIQKTECDVFNGIEANVNWLAMPRHGRLNKWFQSENALRVSSAHNTHENNGRRQQGGTFQLVMGQMASWVTEVGHDPTGLGRWCWIKFSGQNGVTARIITVYVPCRSAEDRQSDCDCTT